MLRIERSALDRQPLAEVPKFFVQAIFIRKQVFEMLYIELSDQVLDIAADGLLVVLAIQADVMYMMPLSLQLCGEGPHGQEEAGYFLNVMADVVGFRERFHEDVKYFAALVFEPGVFYVELVAQD